MAPTLMAETFVAATAGVLSSHWAAEAVSALRGGRQSRPIALATLWAASRRGCRRRLAAQLPTTTPATQ